MKKHDIYQKILDVAENLIQTQGYNAFSYKDISALVGVKTSSIHYYFPTKADLGKAIVKKHIDSLCEELEHLIENKNLSCKKKLERFIDGIITKTYLDKQKMCLGGMLASDILTLPDIIKKEVRIFFTRLEDWISRLLRESIEKKEFQLERKAIKSETLFIFSLIEGALLLARLFQDEGHLTVARKHILARYCKE